MDRFEPLISAQDLADYLGVPIATIYTWRHRRLGPPGFRVGKHLRYRRRDVEEWISGRLEESQGAFGNPAFPVVARRTLASRGGAGR